MKVARGLLVTGGLSLAIATGALVLPDVQPVGASPVSVESPKSTERTMLKSDANASFDVKTELNAGDHVLWTTVSNKTDKPVTPQVTFNGEEPLYAFPMPIEPGENRMYAYYFSGNEFSVEVKVMGEGLESVTSLVNIAIQEPVSFTATETSDTAIIGTLRNNSTLVPQTVYTRVANGDVHVENLKAGESRTVVMSHMAVEGQEQAAITIATSTGYESGYWVELGLKPLPHPIPTQ